MLSKEICKKCCNERKTCPDWNGMKWRGRSDIEKLLSDEEHWEQGVVWCVVACEEILVKGDPPVECPYYLEQVVSDVE